MIIGVTIVSSLLALAIFLKWGSLNSDLGQLIRPSDQLNWYQANEAFKRDFPQLQQTAIVVLRGSDAAEVSRATQAMHDRLKTEAGFASVFAPTIDPYIERHRLHFLSKDQLAAWQKGADYTYGAVLRLADETSLENFAFTLTDFVSANPGQPLPVALDTLLEVLEGAPDAYFSTFYPLVDPNQAEHLEFIVVQGTQNLDQPLPNAQIVAQLETVSTLITHAFNVDVALTGEVALANEEIGAALTGIEIAGALSVVIIALILGVGLRSYRVIGIIFAKLLLGSCLTLGAATILVGSFNTLSMLFVVMFFGLGIDFSLHFILRAMADGFVNEQGLKSTFKDTAPALGLCTLTSAIAFLAFVPTDYLGLGELGLISAAGMLIALFLTLLFVPAAYLKWHTHSASTRTSLSVTRKVRLTPRGARLLGCLFLVGSPLALAIALDTQFNYNVLSMRDPDSSAMRALVDLQESGYETDYSIQLTASGGAFRDWAAADLAKATVADATSHPNWSMGRKITVDSASLMNKGLEVIEAHYLYGVDYDHIEIVIHPQSIIHSMVELADSSVLAQLGWPDMKLPIQYALFYPDRVAGPARRLDFSETLRLDFEPPDLERFPAVRLGHEVAARGGTAGAVLNAANEEAVQAFLDGAVRFPQIAELCERAVAEHPFQADPSLDDILGLDAWARKEVRTWMNR